MREHKEATTQEIPCVVASFFISWHRQVETPGQISRRSYRPLGQSKSQANRLGSSGSALVEPDEVELSDAALLREYTSKQLVEEVLRRIAAGEESEDE